MKHDKSPAGDGQQYEKVGEFVAIFARKDVWYVNYQHGNRQVRRSLKTRSKKEARRRALMIEKEILSGEHRHLRRTPLIKEVIEQYIASRRSEGRSEKTVGKYQYGYDLLLEIAEHCNRTRISELDVTMVAQFRAERIRGSETRRPAKPKTVHNDTVCIKQLVKFALKRGMIAENPLRDLEIDRPKRTPQPCWDRAQVEQILASTKPPYESPLIFLAETGTRVGEAKWLTHDDVDLERRLIHIRPKDGWKPKSGDQRAIPMTDRLFAMLSAIPKRGRWVFTARVTTRHPEVGRQISERRLLQYLKRVLKRLGYVGHLHTFRHSFISFAANTGVPERLLRQWIGHADREILDWYYHLADRESKEAMQRLSKASKLSQPKDDLDLNSAQTQHNPQED
jgi:site-specific recombinase XerD